MRFFLTLGTLAVVVPALGGMLVMTPADEKNVIEVNDFIDEQVAFTNYAETAEIVAFERMPRRNLLHSWKGLGVTLLKTVRFEREGIDTANVSSELIKSASSHSRKARMAFGFRTRRTCPPTGRRR